MTLQVSAARPSTVLACPLLGKRSLVQVSDEFFVGAVNGIRRFEYPLALFGNTGFLAEILISEWDQLHLVSTAHLSAQFLFRLARANNYTVDLDFATGSISGFVDGVLIGTGSLPIGTTDVDGIDSASTAQADRPLRALRTICRSPLPQFPSRQPGR